MSLTRAQVEGIAHLARLEISEAQMPVYVDSLSRIIDLVVALAEDDGARFQTLRSTRPASDNLQAVVSTLGRYQVVAPR